MPPQPLQQASQPPPDEQAQKAPPLNIVEREQASAWHLILTLPDGGCATAFQKVEADARRALASIDPTTATEAEMRCAITAWKHAMGIVLQMSSFVAGVHRRLEAEEKASKQNNLDKPADSGTMAKD